MVKIEVLDTDITKLDVEAIANAANTDLKHGGGAAGAIAGGGAIQRESAAAAAIGLGEAVEASGGEMPEIDEVFQHRDAGGSAIERVVFAVHGDAPRAAFEAALSG
jgi:O-acetyl-ADP-ribose deacetylase (regulator of RNase III)